MYYFAFQPSMAAGMVPSLLTIFVKVGCGRVVSCSFDAFLVEWISLTDFSKIIFSICTCASPRCQSTAVEPTMKAHSIFQRKMLETTRGITRPHRKYGTDPCAILELNHLVLAFFPHPCAKTPICAKTPVRAKTPILTVHVVYLVRV